MTRIQLVSDTHSGKIDIDNTVDFVIHAGDITNYGFKKPLSIPWDHSIKSIEESKVPVYWVPGNHDIDFKRETKIGNDLCHNVLEKTLGFKDISITGVSMSVCYNLPRLADYWDHMTCVDREEQKYYETFLNKYFDIVVSHSPPTGIIGSEVQCGDIGSKYLLEYIEEYQPKLVVCGHVHNPLAREQWVGNTLVINVARISKTIEYEEVIK